MTTHQQRLDKKRVEKPFEAGTWRVALSALFTWPLNQDLVENNPAHNKKLDIPDGCRDRALDTDEIRTFRHTLNEASINDALKDILRLELVTAMRIGSIVSIRPEHIDRQKHLLRTPKENVKGGWRDLWPRYYRWRSRLSIGRS